MDILDDRDLRGGGYEPATPLLSMESDYGDVIPPSQLRRSRRSQRAEPHLNITSFVDVLSVLLFFLLSVATLEKLGAHDVNLPKQTDSFAAESTVELKNLSLSLGREGAKLRGLIAPKDREPEALSLDIPLRDGRYDVAALQGELLRLKGAYKTDDAIILMVGDEVTFDSMVQVMDTVREKIEYDAGVRHVTTLFPDVSLSDYLVDQQV